MGGKKQTTTDSQQYTNANQSGSFDTTNENELGFADVPTANWEGYNALKGFDPSASIKADASIPFRFGAQRRRAMGIFGNPGGAYNSPELAASRQLSALGDIGQAEGAASAADAARVSEQLGDANFRKFSTMAGLTQPVTFNKKSRSFGTTAEQASGQSLGKEIVTQPKKSLFGSILGGLLGTAQRARSGGGGF